MNATVLRCHACGAELLPQTSFCRQCGIAIGDNQSAQGSEQPTALLPQSVDGTTQRLDPRTTSPDHVRMVFPAGVKSSKRRLMAAVIVAVVLLVLGIVAAVAYVRIRSHSITTSSDALFYPGAHTVVDVVNEDGGRATQLETTDPPSVVESWYTKRLNPTKTMKLNSSTTVLKNQNTTVTIATEGSNTSILIKFAR